MIRFALWIAAVFWAGFAPASHAQDLPLEWTAWLKASQEISGDISAEEVALHPEARAMDSWLATRNQFQLRSFESKMRDVLFYSSSSESYNIEISAKRSQAARALFSLSSSLRMQNLARRFLFGSPLRRRLNPYSGTGFMFHGFFSFFYAHQHWRRAEFWSLAVADLVFAEPKQLLGITAITPNQGAGFEDRVNRWKISLLRSEWNTAPADQIIPTLEELVERVPSEGLENFLLSTVLSRKDMIANSEWKYWLWSMLNPLLPYVAKSPQVAGRAKNIIRLLLLPGAEVHLVLIEQLLRRPDRSLDEFIESEILSKPPYLGHPLLAKVGRGPNPSILRLRYGFAIGDSLNLWSPSIGRSCQAYLRRGYLQVARRIGIHPVQLIKAFGVKK